ncbi:YybH family protein [Halomonas cerina]|uniref:Ketosteroid isomerase-like protein n=1 Tax=Halomonas cerina TaxID=447424 RepID=A0A839VAD5_9GAMM|nr:nuclear transport factor 2 family protein [Halomonas cerina]MBB3192583.1 ketosteroid isomerase-like protein [Halomonas cerina]
MHVANKILVTILLALASICAYAAESLFEEIDAANQAFASAVERGDIDHIIESYTDTACVIAPSTPKACSRESIRALWTAVAESGVKEVKIKTQEVESSGELAYATGTLTVTDTHGNTQKSNYVLVFKKVADEWKLHLDIWAPSGQAGTGSS